MTIAVMGRDEMDDITFCMSECKQTDCFRHPSNIQDRTIPHSYADFKGTETCPEFAKDINAPVNDSISRQAAIDALIRAREPINNGDGTSTIMPLTDAAIRKVLTELPSVQSDIIQCKDCVNWQTEWEPQGEPGIHFCDMVDGFPDGDWYCADGERRDG